MTVVAMERLRESVGSELGPTEPVLIGQDRINGFADATDDHQWIHVDVDRAAGGPYQGTIAHGYLTLSLTGAAVSDLLEVPDATSIVNYGLNKVRFPSIVLVSSLLRVSGHISDVAEVTGGFQVTLTLAAHVDGQDRPACVAEAIVRFMQ